MYLKTVFDWAQVLLAGSLAAGDYVCKAKPASFTIQRKWAQAAMEKGETTEGLSGFPHDFHGGSGSGKTQLHFYGGVDPRCNKKNPELFEFPVMKDGSEYNKTRKHDDGTTTPARVVYLKDGKTLCGVMTHVIERKDHTGKGDFRVCDVAKFI